MSTDNTVLSPAEVAHGQLREVRAVLADRSRFEPTRHDQWRRLSDGRLVESGYVYGAPWARTWLPEHGQHSAQRFEFTGRDREQVDRLLALLA